MFIDSVDHKDFKTRVFNDVFCKRYKIWGPIKGHSNGTYYITFRKDINKTEEIPFKCISEPRENGIVLNVLETPKEESSIASHSMFNMSNVCIKFITMKEGKYDDINAFRKFFVHNFERLSQFDDLQHPHMMKIIGISDLTDIRRNPSQFIDVVGKPWDYNFALLSEFLPDPFFPRLCMDTSDHNIDRNITLTSEDLGRFKPRCNKLRKVRWNALFDILCDIYVKYDTVYTDIKHQNVLLGRGSPVLIDFGGMKLDLSKNEKNSHINTLSTNHKDSTVCLFEDDIKTENNMSIPRCIVLSMVYMYISMRYQHPNLQERVEYIMNHDRDVTTFDKRLEKVKDQFIRFRNEEINVMTKDRYDLCIKAIEDQLRAAEANKKQKISA